MSEEHMPPDALLGKKINDRLSKPESWILRYEDGSPVPKIKSVEGQAGMFYTLTLEEELVENNKVLTIQVRAAEGMVSKSCKLLI